MQPRLSEVLNALPHDLDAPDIYEGKASLQQLLNEISGKPVPVGRFNRAWILGTLQAKIAAAYLAYWIRSSYTSVEKNERRLNETHLKGALRLLGGMGYLRGAIMKIGQALANYPNIVPDEYIELLGQLHFEAPPMHYSLLREMIHNELGKDPEELFEEFDTHAFAAASLGQVHRARLKTGEEVAVKIQYPNIGRTIRDDFRNMSAILLPMRLHRDWDNIKEQLEDIRETLALETDYINEAQMLRIARSSFQEDDGIVVPRVYDQLSTNRILTMDYIEGDHLSAFLSTNPSQELRDHFGQLIMFSGFRMHYKQHMCYADPHPGNYLFMNDGRLGLIDFGCCRILDDQEWAYNQCVQRGLEQGGEAYQESLVQTAVPIEGASVIDEQMALLDNVVRWFNDLLKVDEPFDFGNDEFIKQGFEAMGELPKHGYIRGLPVCNWIARYLVGVRVMCYRLKARVNMKKIYDQEGRISATM